MTPRPAFIISFDCEGKWGMADHLEGRHAALDSSELASAYERLADMLDRRGLRATFAFVGAFTMSEVEARARRTLFDDVGPRARAWVRPFLADLDAGRPDGWLAPGALSAATRSGSHEAGTHGFLHLPLAEGEVDEAELRREFASVRALAPWAGRDDLTLVYPRNQVGFPERLPEFGVIGYRESLALERGARSSSWRHLWDELDPWPRSQPHPSAASGAVAIPAGRFLNWRSGARERIPAAWTVRGWRSALADAAASGGVAHLWSHPHNFLTGRGMFELFDAVLAEAEPLVRSGTLWNPTMREYARTLKGL